MIDFACVSSTTPTWSNDPRWCTPGIAATEAEHAAMEDDDGDDGGKFIDPCDWVDDLPRAYHDFLRPLGVRRPSLFKPRRDGAGLYFTETNKTVSMDEN
eukprot:jgi/Tetstr1/430381/TSEL_020191.t1